MMSDDKKLNEEQLKNVSGGTSRSTYVPDGEWIVHGSNINPNGDYGLDYEKDGEWTMDSKGEGVK